ncbi:mercuric transport protein periplasmic component precursor [Oxobacter pfennigii]|uniref:Mercuric transport protein periplasmic component n=1 Tax=Oxobacter pfennigii TaxID=36849 RepID=A0A0P9AFT2_9CLOT|nr:heavy-metal-associated domain-containing protein [Oxobacter pfennigii]KPU44220.1 mercuric transport protein periplasmic component precursor [Oxobacter pfennigii]
MKKKLLVEGMSCMHCVNHVKNALSEISGVTDVKVDLEGKNAVVEFDNVDDEKFKAAVADAGYEVVGIESL